MNAFPFSSAIDKTYPVLTTITIQKIQDLLQICCAAFFRNRKAFPVFLIDPCNRCSYFGKHFFFPFSYGLFPHKGIFIGTSLQFCSIDEDSLLGKFPHCSQPTHHLIKQIFTCFQKETCPKACNRAVIRCFLARQQPHKVDVSFTCGFDFSGWINILWVRVGQDLEHGLWINCRISALGRVSLIQQRVI